jgi:MYXO-CTERM domain-containing protein
MYMKSIQYIAAVAAIAAAASATAQVAFTSTLSAVGGSGVNGGFGGSYISPVAVGAAGGAIGGGGSVSATGTAVVVSPDPGPAVANVPSITSATLTGAGGFSALITPTLISSVQGSDGIANVGTLAFPVYVDVRTDSYTLTLAPGTLLPVGTGTYSINLFNNANVLISQGTFNATVSVVPEPETYAAAAALGLVGFGLWRRRNA